MNFTLDPTNDHVIDLYLDSRKPARRRVVRVPPAATVAGARVELTDDLVTVMRRPGASAHVARAMRDIVDRRLIRNGGRARAV